MYILMPTPMPTVETNKAAEQGCPDQIKERPEELAFPDYVYFRAIINKHRKNYLRGRSSWISKMLVKRVRADTKEEYFIDRGQGIYMNAAKQALRSDCKRRRSSRHFQAKIRRISSGRNS